MQNSIRAMLTPFVCRLMREGENEKVLKLLNSNVEDPYIIWDNASRAELLDFVERHRNSAENTVLTFTVHYELTAIFQSELFGAEFRLSAYAKELTVGDIFIRIYNQQPEFKLYVRIPVHQRSLILTRCRSLRRSAWTC